MQLVYKGNEVYQSLFKHLGTVTMKSGRRIIRNNNFHTDKTWIAICYSGNYGQIYVCERCEKQQTNLSQQWPEIQPSGQPQTWYGKKYINFKLNYEGHFYGLMKYTNKEKAYQYFQIKQNQQISSGLQTFQGHFKYDKRHSDPNVKDNVIVRNGGNIFINMIGMWQNGNKQGQFTMKKLDTKFRPIKFFHNDIEINANNTVKRTPIAAFPEMHDNLNIGISPEGVNSLKIGSCLSSQMLDLFFKHLNVSFEKFDAKYKNMKSFTVFMFEKLVPSNEVSNQKKGKVKINYKNIQKFGEVYKDVSSIFEINPLLLFPLNRDRSHFALGAIISQITRNNNTGILQKVKFKIMYLDSLHMCQDHVPLILEEYIYNQIAKIQGKQRQIYQKAFQDIRGQYDFKKLQFSRQQNQVDCGVFTCLYGFLLTLQVCVPQSFTINWQFKSTTIIPNLRLIIKLDAMYGIHNFFNCLLKQFIKQKIIFKKQT